MAITLSGDGIARANLAADVIDSTKLADDAVDTEHLADDAVDSAEIAAGAIDAAHMSANSIDSDSYVDGSIDTAHIANDQITNALMADDAVGVAQLSATGTASSSTYLRGDNSWATAGSTSASDLTSGTLPAARMPSKSILQVVQGSVTSATHMTGSFGSYVTVGLSANITPSSSSSKILISVAGGGHRIDAHDMAWMGNVFRDSTDLADTLYSKTALTNHYVYGGTQNSAYDYEFPESLLVLDEPATTSQITYTYKVKPSNTTKWNVGDASTTITLMEIAG